MNDTLTAVPGIEVGHTTRPDAATGCTVVLCPRGVRAGVSVRGAAPGTRELALLAPHRTVDEVHAVLIGGGSAFGLAAADGVVRWLEERGFGYPTPVNRVPIVPAAVLFDLQIGASDVRPGAEDGYRACLGASAEPVEQGNVGAGTGATVGKILGLEQCTRGGLGSAAVVLPSGATVGALVAVNALGDVVDPETGRIVAGARSSDAGGWADTERVLLERGAPFRSPVSTNTTLAVVATDARLSKAQLMALAGMAHDGLARAVRPVHTVWDGDTVFALSTGSREEDLMRLGVAAVRVVAEAVVRAVRHARSAHGVPACTDLPREPA